MEFCDLPDSAALDRLPVPDAHVASAHPNMQLRRSMLATYHGALP